MSVFGPPARLLSDRGANFLSELVLELCKILNVDKINTTAYHPQGNGQVERVHQTLTNMIGSLDQERKEDWPKHLKAITFAYNCTRSAVTGYSPHFLMFGVRPRIPVDFLFPTARTTHGKPSQRPVDAYIADLQERLKRAFADARSQVQKEAERQKVYYDRRVNSSVLKPGDRVLIRKNAVRGKRKIQDRWSDSPCEVLEKVGTDLPLYRVESAGGKTQVVHRNRLLHLTGAKLSGAPVSVSLQVVETPTLCTTESQQAAEPDDGQAPTDELAPESATSGGVMCRFSWTHGKRRLVSYPALVLSAVHNSSSMEIEDDVSSVSSDSEVDLDLSLLDELVGT